MKTCDRNNLRQCVRKVPDSAILEMFKATWPISPDGNIRIPYTFEFITKDREYYVKVFEFPKSYYKYALEAMAGWSKLFPKIQFEPSVHSKTNARDIITFAISNVSEEELGGLGRTITATIPLENCIRKPRIILHSSVNTTDLRTVLTHELGHIIGIKKHPHEVSVIKSILKQCPNAFGASIMTISYEDEFLSKVNRPCFKHANSHLQRGLNKPGPLDLKILKVIYANNDLYCGTIARKDSIQPFTDKVMIHLQNAIDTSNFEKVFYVSLLVAALGNLKYNNQRIISQNNLNILSNAFGFFWTLTQDEYLVPLATHGLLLIVSSAINKIRGGENNLLLLPAFITIATISLFNLLASDYYNLEGQNNAVEEILLTSLDITLGYGLFCITSIIGNYTGVTLSNLAFNNRTWISKNVNLEQGKSNLVQGESWQDTVTKAGNQTQKIG